jgi:hypothetical protein
VADENYTQSDGTEITDEAAQKIVEEVYDAIDRGAYKVITDKFRKTQVLTIPPEKIQKQLLHEIQNA